MLRDHAAITGERRRWARGDAKQVMRQALTDPCRRRVGARQTEMEKYRSVNKCKCSRRLEMPGATLRHVRGKEVSQSRESNLDMTHLPVPGDALMI